MKLFILTLFLTSLVHAGCDETQLIFRRSTTIGIDTSNGTSVFGREETVNIPLIIDGKQACYHQKNGIQVFTKEIKEAVFVDYEINPISVNFENVPDADVVQYLDIEYDPENRASKLFIMSFLCSGETPIGGDAFSDSLKRLAEQSPEEKQETQVFIATGQAAENINLSEKNKKRAKIFDHFLSLYEDNLEGDEILETEVSNVFIPNVLGGISIEGVTNVERKLYSSFFSRINSSINGCSKVFRERMNSYLMENVLKYRRFPGVLIGKKRFSPRYKLRWYL